MDVVVDFFLEAFADRVNPQAPEVFGRAQFSLAVFNPEVYGFRADSFHHDRIKPGILQLRSPVASGIRVSQRSGQGRFCGHGQTTGRRGGRAVQWTGRKD